MNEKGRGNSVKDATRDHAVHKTSKVTEFQEHMKNLETLDEIYFGYYQETL